jgi:glucokinase
MFLGIEIGGTKLQLGIGPGNGSLRGLWRETVDVAAGPEGIRRQILRAVPDLLAQSGVSRDAIAGIGIGFGGPVDDSTQNIIKSHQIEGWDDFPLARWISEMLGWQAVLGNDADVAGLAEATCGAAKGLSPVFYITIGSGIGGGFVVNGEIYRGCGRGAAEIGHLKVREPDLVTYTPLEEHSSGWAIAKKARERAKAQGRGSRLDRLDGHSLRAITAESVAEAAAGGDRFALAILQDAVSHLADGICHVIALLCPRRIVIGGGVSLMGEELLFLPLRKMVAERVFRPFVGCYDIVPAALGEEVVVHGAIVLARRQAGGHTHDS